MWLLDAVRTSSSSSSLSSSAQLFALDRAFDEVITGLLVSDDDIGTAATSSLIHGAGLAFTVAIGFCGGVLVDRHGGEESSDPAPPPFSFPVEFPHTALVPVGTKGTVGSLPLFSLFKEGVFNGVGAAAGTAAVPIDLPTFDLPTKTASPGLGTPTIVYDVMK